MEACRRTDSGRFSRRRPLISAELGLLLLSITAASGAQPPAAAAPIDSVAALERFVTDVGSLTADFFQELWTADQRMLEKASGTLALKRPNHFLWIYREPYEQRVIADGEALWMYDVDLAQASVTPLDESVSSSPAMLLAGDQQVRDAFDVAASYSAGGLDWVRLTPKQAGADFSSVLIGFEGASPRQLELVDGLNQVTRIVFANIVLNPELADDGFVFSPPPGVDVIGGD